jgi:hypothetical protein
MFYTHLFIYLLFVYVFLCIIIILMLLIWLYIGDPWTFGTPYESDEHLSAFGQM